VSPFFGKYRGKVVNNVDPMQMGRLQVSAPAVLGEGKLSWAMPCVPYAGKNVGFFALPPKDANVWVEFEGGDPDYPIWSGGFWDKGQVPAKPAVAEIKVFKTEGIRLVLNDARGAGGLTLNVGPPAVNLPIKITADGRGVQLSLQSVTVKITSRSVDLLVPPGSLKLSPANVEARHAGASVKLQQIRVSLNNGALDVM
jgi:hypothetical protein